MFFVWLPLILFIQSINFTPRHSLEIPRLFPFPQNTLVSIDTQYTKTFYYKQVLDHFNYRPESYTTFDQRYVINFKHWGGAKSNASIFVYFGAEAPLDGYVDNIGFMNENSATFKALLVYIEVFISFNILSVCSCPGVLWFCVIFFFYNQTTSLYNRSNTRDHNIIQRKGISQPSLVPYLHSITYKSMG